MSYEETEFLKRAVDVDARIVFKGDIKVYHKLYSNRLTMPYLLRRARYDGVSEHIIYPKSIKKTLECLKRIMIFFD